jgi:hypothetical protein
MGGDLPRGEDIQDSVPQFYVGRVEQPDLFETHDVLEVPPPPQNLWVEK